MELYDNNPTLDINKEQVEESRQGDVFFKEQMLKKAEGSHKKFYIESYGCQMNFSDSEIVASILSDMCYEPTRDMEASDLILVNTCSIREKAEDTVRKRLEVYNSVTKPLVEYYSSWAHKTPVQNETAAPQYLRIEGLGTIKDIMTRTFLALL